MASHALKDLNAQHEGQEPPDGKCIEILKKTTSQGLSRLYHVDLPKMFSMLFLIRPVNFFVN